MHIELREMKLRVYADLMCSASDSSLILIKKNRQSGLMIYSSFRVGVPVKLVSCEVPQFKGPRGIETEHCHLQNHD